jgi:hypothetical protein
VKESRYEQRRSGWFGRLLPWAKRQRLCQFAAGEQHQIVGHHGGPDVGLEMIEPAPGAASGAIDAFEAGDPGLDPGTEVARWVESAKLG